MTWLEKAGFSPCVLDFGSSCLNQSLELLMKKKKKEEISRGGPGTNLICAIWGILETNLKKSSLLQFMMNTSSVPSICICRPTILIFIDKKYAYFFPHGKYFSRDFWFSFPQELSFPRWIPGSAQPHHHEGDRWKPTAWYPASENNPHISPLPLNLHTNPKSTAASWTRDNMLWGE